jgi:Acetyltransferase (GNAT) family
MATDPILRPVDNAGQLCEYIDTYWRRGHVLAKSPEMFDFTYRTPWVDERVFPDGISVLGLYDGPRMVGFLGAIVAPYPRPQSYWLALWHVLPEMKGGGFGGRLLARMQEIAEAADGWIGTFGAGPEAVPVYLKRGYAVRAARRWVYAPDAHLASQSKALADARLHSTECPPDEEWMNYRFRQHPVFRYDRRPGAIMRTENNAWGRVTHVCRLEAAGAEHVAATFAGEARRAAADGQRYLMDAWSFDCPGAGWTLASEDLPSLFHPVEARGNLIYAVGRPFPMSSIHKGDCDQDRPNTSAEIPAGVLSSVAAGH